MKKLSFICILCLCTALQTNAQLRDTTLNMSTHKVDANALLQKSKKQKAAAWWLLGGGAVASITGLSIIGNDVSKDLSDGLTTLFSFGYVTPAEHKHSAAGPILAIAGTGAMLGSIPLFISAAKNKNKARLVIKDEHVFFNPQLSLKEHLVSMGIKINL